jgi:anti-sigma regulatory factor (Ser/Thr protein kinase)
LRVEAEFDGDVETVRCARKFVARALHGWDLDRLSEVACLLTSELAANAVSHAGSMYRLVVEWEASQLQIQVIDRSPVLPRQSLAPVNQDSGKGLVLVEALAAGWGTRPAGEGKSVWFALKAEEENS